MPRRRENPLPSFEFSLLLVAFLLRFDLELVHNAMNSDARIVAEIHSDHLTHIAEHIRNRLTFPLIPRRILADPSNYWELRDLPHHALMRTVPQALQRVYGALTEVFAGIRGAKTEQDFARLKKKLETIWDDYPARNASARIELPGWPREVVSRLQKLKSFVFSLLKVANQDSPEMRERFLMYTTENNMQGILETPAVSAKPLEFLEFMMSISLLMKRFLVYATNEATQEHILLDNEYHDLLERISQMTVIGNFYGMMENARRNPNGTAVSGTLEYRLARTVDGLTSLSGPQLDPNAIRERVTQRRHRPIIDIRRPGYIAERRQELSKRILELIECAIKNLDKSKLREMAADTKKKLKDHSNALKKSANSVEAQLLAFETACTVMRILLASYSKSSSMQKLREVIQEQITYVRYELWTRMMIEDKIGFMRIRHLMDMLVDQKDYSGMKSDKYVSMILDQASILFLDDLKEMGAVSSKPDSMDELLQALRNSVLNDEPPLTVDPDQGRASRPAPPAEPRPSSQPTEPAQRPRRRTRLTGGGLEGVPAPTGELDFRNPARAEPAQPELAQPDLAQSDLAQPEPAQSEPAQPEPTLALPRLLTRNGNPNRRLAPLTENRIRINEHWWWGVLFEYPEGSRVVWFDSYGAEITNTDEAIRNPPNMPDSATFIGTTTDAIQMDEFGNWGVRFRLPSGEDFTKWYTDNGCQSVD